MFGIRSKITDLQQVAKLIIEDYRRYPQPRLVFDLGQNCQIDLKTGEGCFELLVYAILLGAKVQRSVVDTTFMQLRQSGLTNSTQLLEPDALAQALTVLSRHYRALTPRHRKAEALVAAARRVQTEYCGDIRQVLTEHGGATDKLLKALRRFEGINLRAYWFCREMSLAGVWPELEPKAYYAIDSDVKVPLWFLGFVGADLFYLRDLRSSECDKAIRDYFAGDVLPLVATARRGCHQGDSNLCQRQCSAYAMCQVRFEKPAGCF